MDYKELEERLTSPKRKMNRADFELKLRANKHIMETLSEEELNSYLEHCDYQAVIDVVDKVYGKEAGDILRERPLSTDDIPTFNIFDSKIRDAIGYGGIHTFLTYYMKSSRIIDEMAENPELLDLYKTYKEQIGDFYPPSAIGLYDGLHTFDKHKDLISEISKVGWDDELRQNFLLRIRDEEAINKELETYDYITNLDREKHSEDEIKDLLETQKLVSFVWLVHQNNTPQNIAELKNYSNSRTQLIDTQMQEFPEKTKSLLVYKYFGNIRENDSYSHKYFLQDYLSFYSAEFSDYEISAIYLYSIIEQTDNIDVLKQIDKALSRTEHINPLDMKSIDSKVAEIYRQEYLNSTITLDKAKRMVENHENGSYKGLLKPDGTIVCEDYKILPDETKQESVVLPSGEIITKSTRHDKSSYEITTTDGNTYPEFNDTISFSPSSYQYFVMISFDTEGRLNQQILTTKQPEGLPLAFHLQDSKVTSCFLNNNTTNFVTALPNFQESEYQEIVNKILTDESYIKELKAREQEIINAKKASNLSSRFKEGEPLKNDITPTEENEQPVYFLNTTEETFFQHMERGFTSDSLRNKINDTLGEKYLVEKQGLADSKVISAEELFVINNSLEGGLSSISAYFNNNTLRRDDWVGYVNKIHPNAIFFKSNSDGSVEHNRKNLSFAGKSTTNLMEFGTSKDKLLFRDGSPGQRQDGAEVAYLRYEWDITKIQPGTKGGRVPIDFIIAGNAHNEKAAKYALCAGVPLVKIMSGKERHTYLEDAPRRKESENISLLRQALDQANDKKITSDEIKTASQLLLKIKEAELQKNDEGR